VPDIVARDAVDNAVLAVVAHIDPIAEQAREVIIRKVRAVEVRYQEADATVQHQARPAAVPAGHIRDTEILAALEVDQTSAVLCGVVLTFYDQSFRY
jgi:hypothetical protein